MKMNSIEFAERIGIKHNKVFKMIDKINCSNKYRELVMVDKKPTYNVSKEICLLVLSRMKNEDEKMLDLLRSELEER